MKYLTLLARGGRHPPVPKRTAEGGRHGTGRGFLGVTWDGELWEKSWRALQRVIVALFFLLAHIALHWMFVFTFSSLPRVAYFTTIASAAAFLVVYAMLLWDIVLIYAPRLRPRQLGG